MRGYRRGIQTVLFTVLASALAASLLTGSQAGPQRAAQDLGDQVQDLGPFQLVERSGQTKSQRDLADRVCIFSFVFTRCQLSCPRISSLMKSLQSKLENTSVLLVSLSVDPDHDSPAVLRDYASRFGAAQDRWWFLTGPRTEIYRLIQDRFKLSVMENPAELPDGKGEAILHSDRLALVDHGRLVGLYDSSDASALDGAHQPGPAEGAAGLGPIAADRQRHPQRPVHGPARGRLELPPRRGFHSFLSERVR